MRIDDKDGSTIYEIPEMEAVINLNALRRRQLKIGKIILLRPTITVKRFSDGRINFIELQKDIFSHADQTPDTETFFSFSLRHLLITDGVIRIYDERLHPSPLQSRIIVDASLDIPKSTGTFVAKFNGHIDAHGNQQGRFSGSAVFPDPTIGFKAELSDVSLSVLEDYIPLLAEWKGRRDYPNDVQLQAG